MKNNNNILAKAILCTTAIFMIIVGLHYSIPKIDNTEFSYELTDSDRFKDSNTNIIDNCEFNEPGANCVTVTFNFKSEVWYSLSIWTKKSYLGGAFDEINQIKPNTFEMKEYTIGRSLRVVNGKNAPFDHTAYWSFSSDHKDCANPDGSYGRCNYGMDGLIIEDRLDIIITYTFL